MKVEQLFGLETVNRFTKLAGFIFCEPFNTYMKSLCVFCKQIKAKFNFTTNLYLL